MDITQMKLFSIEKYNVNQTNEARCHPLLLSEKPT